MAACSVTPTTGAKRRPEGFKHDARVPPWIRLSRFQSVWPWRTMQIVRSACAENDRAMTTGLRCCDARKGTARWVWQHQAVLLVLRKIRGIGWKPLLGEAFQPVFRDTRGAYGSSRCRRYGRVQPRNKR